MNRMLSIHEERFKEYSKRLQELTKEVMKKENCEYSEMEAKLNRATEDCSRKLVSVKKDKRDQIKRVQNEIEEIKESIKSNTI